MIELPKCLLVAEAESRTLTADSDPRELVALPDTESQS